MKNALAVLGLVSCVVAAPTAVEAASRALPVVGQRYDGPGSGRDCTVVRVGPKAFSYTSSGKTLLLLHVEHTWVGSISESTETFTMVVDPTTPSAKVGRRELLTPEHPRTGHYFLLECVRRN